MTTAPTRTARYTYASTDELAADYRDRGWTDGLPIVAPTPDRVAAFLDACGADARDVVGIVATRDIVVDAEAVAINAVMAGAEPRYMPAILAAARAFLDERMIPHSVSATLAGAAQAVLVHWPLCEELGVASGQSCFGPGFPANATIGRALRLMIFNAMRTVPGGLDRATFSTPARYSFCFGEAAPIDGWPALEVDSDDDAAGRPVVGAVTVQSTLTPITVMATEGPEDVIARVTTALHFDNGIFEHQMGDIADILVIVGDDHSRAFAAAGWSREDTRRALWEALEPLRGADGKPHRLGRPEGIRLFRAGGSAYPVTVVLPPHVGLSVTRPVYGRSENA